MSQTHLINATSVTLGVSVWAPVSHFNKFTAIENDALGFQLFSLLWIETIYFFLGGNGLFCTLVQLYQMLHNSGLQLPQCSRRFIGFTCNVSLHMRSSGKLFSLWCQQVESLESTSQLPHRNQNYRLFTYECSQTVDFHSSVITMMSLLELQPQH